MAYTPVSQRNVTTSYIPVQQREKPILETGSDIPGVGTTADLARRLSVPRETQKLSFSVDGGREQERFAFPTTSAGSTPQTIKEEDVDPISRTVTDLTFELGSEGARFVKSAIESPRVVAEEFGLIDRKRKDDNELIETYQDGVRRRMEEGDSLGWAIAKTFGQVALEEPVGYAFKPLFFGLGIAWRALRGAGNEATEQFIEGVARSKSEDDIVLMFRRAAPEVSEDEARLLARELAKVDDVEQVRSIIQGVGSKVEQDIAKGFREAIPQAQRTSDGIIAPAARATDDVMAPAARTADDLGKIAAEMKALGKTFDEFVEAQGTPVYRGEGGSDIAQGKALLAEGRHFADDAEYPKRFGDVSEYVIKPNAKIFDAGDGDFGDLRVQLGIDTKKKDKFAYISPKDLTSELKKQGYDLLMYNGTYKSTGKPFTHYVEITPNALVSRSQLTDIWNKANKSTQKAVSTTDNLITEAKKYKSADEFVNSSYVDATKQYHAFRTSVRNNKPVSGEITLFRGVNKSSAPQTFDSNVGIQHGAYWTPSQAHATAFAGNSGEVMKLTINADELAALRKSGGVKTFENEVIFTDGTVTSRAQKVPSPSQLTDIWNRANTRATSAQKELPPRNRQLETESTKTRPQESTQTASKGAETDQVPQTSDIDSSYTIKIDDDGVPVKANLGAPEDKIRATPEEMERIVKISKADGMYLSTPLSAGTKIPPKNLIADMRARIEKSSAKIPDEEVARMRNEMLLEPEVLSDAIVRKRGIRTIAEMTEAAKMSRETTDNLIALQRGSVVSGEGMKVAGQLVQYERELLKDIRSLINGGGIAQTPSERATLKRLGHDGKAEITILNDALAEQTVRTIKAELAYIGLRSEAGRALRATREYVDSVDMRLRAILSRAKHLDEDVRTALIERLSKLDLNDNKLFMSELDKLNNADIFDKIAEAATVAKLWNPTTHVVNIGGNAVRQGADIAIKTVTNPTVAAADWKGAAVGIRQGLKNAVKAMTDEGYAQLLSKHIELGGQAPAIKGKIGKVARYPFQMLAAGDEIFRAIGFNRSMYRQAFIQARKEGHKGLALNNRMKDLLERPSLKMTDNATDEAKRLTFQEEMGEIISKIDTLRTPAAMKTRTSKLFSTLFRAFVPFLKTPTNLFKQAIDFSPVGLLKNNEALRDAIKTGDKEKIGTIIGEAVVGSALMYYMWEQYQEGNVTGGAPKEKSEKDKFYRENKLPYAIKVGDTWVQYKRVDPFATMLGLTADVATLKKEGDDFGFGSVLYLLSQQLSDKTYLQGVNDMMNLLGAGEDWEAEYAWKSVLLGGALPSIIGHTARSIDSKVRVADTLEDRFKAIIPGMSEDLTSQVNVLGYDIERANKGLNYFFNPIQTQSAYIDPITKELMKINKVVAVPQKYFVRDGVRYNLSAEEYETYAKKTGKRLRDELKKLFESNKYKTSDLDEKEAMIDTLRKNIQDEYKDEYLKKKKKVNGETPTPSSSGNIFEGTF